MDRKKLLAIICLAVAVLLIIYPIVGRHFSNRTYSEVVYSQAETVCKTSPEEIIEELEAADRYNASLTNGLASITWDERDAAGTGYDSLLNLAGDGVIGTIEIPILGTKLPIAHGTDSETLEHYVGHVLGSSLPVGGWNTHAVLSGHSGMATSRMFSDLEQLRLDDYFVIHVLGQDLYYLVDRIDVVLPDDTSLLGIEPGEDYVTLVTCTPYGINTHRLLVRGTRIAEEDVPALPTERHPVGTTQDWQGVVVIIGASVIFLAVFIIVRRSKR